ncbi:SRPBCC family protein [Moheibacter sediminis]|uniref:Ligand-binding SRPBCC domain-containing protein n=1 Tax=Moheibacter sediminis TaxID=1434700 RepID=A0A1W2B183_9FLAO|nr:SRPBCC family protein [Moheibacter sediminis]SMC66168.1 Ligand-binding SRPBCC domain-containing protein [Moheibacter sediminis]
MKYQLKRTQQLYTDLKSAWDFFSLAHNLSKITPKDMNFRVMSDVGEIPIYEGMTIDYKVSPLLGISMNWQTEIIKVEHQKLFVDFQKKGPYKIWHHLHEFEENENGVLMTDTVDYELPFGMFGNWVNHLIVRKKLDKIFKYRKKVLDEKWVF